MIECQNISFRVEGIPLLDDINWQFSRRKITAIIGANGAGKSTLLKTLLGSLKPESGSVQIGGQPIAQWSLQELAVRRAYMAQTGVFKLGVSVLEYLLLARVHYCEPQAMSDAYVNEVIQLLCLQSLAHKRLDSLSGGEYQRVELGRAWCQLIGPEQLDDKLLLLDEPASALDINQSQKLYHYLQRFVSDGGTVIVVEHDINTAAKYCDEILFLKQGQCLAAGDKATVFTETNLNHCFNVNGRLLQCQHSATLSFSL